LELRQLQYLARIARVGGFRRAADELDMSQATLSEQIKLLEHELGVRLFERGSRTLTLTEPGRVLLERAERILEEVKTAQEEMLEFAHLNRGQLIFGTMTGVGSVWLPGFIAAFMRLRSRGYSPKVLMMVVRTVRLRISCAIELMRSLIC